MGEKGVEGQGYQSNLLTGEMFPNQESQNNEH